MEGWAVGDQGLSLPALILPSLPPAAACMIEVRQGILAWPS